MKKRRTTRAGASGKGPSENDHGTGPATSASPAASANTNETSEKNRSSLPIQLHLARNEVTRPGMPSGGLEPDEDSDGADAEIEVIFRRKIAGLRRLPRRERAQALREAREWLAFARTALRAKKAAARHTRYMLWRQSRLPPPSPNPSRLKGGADRHYLIGLRKRRATRSCGIHCQNVLQDI
jgi:hypothetical protein